MTSEEQNSLIVQAVSGLIKYTANCAATGGETKDLTVFTLDFASFYFEIEQDGEPSLRDEMASAVSNARESGKASELSVGEKYVILEGLAEYADGMTGNGGMEQWVAQCQYLAQRLRTEWEQQRDGANVASLLSPRTQGMCFLKGDSFLKVLDADYFDRKERVTNCLRLLPAYTAYLNGQGRNEEAEHMKALGIEMESFWYDENDFLSGMLSPEAFQEQMDSGNADQARVPGPEEEQAIQSGIDAHNEEVEDDPAAAALHKLSQSERTEEAAVAEDGAETSEGKRTRPAGKVKKNYPAR